MLHDGIEWVLFDAVGTLIYADPPVAEVYHAIGRRHGSELTPEVIGQRFRTAFVEQAGPARTTSEAFERERWQRVVGQVIDDVPEKRAVVFEELWEHFARPEHWRIYDDAPATLEQLRQRGFRLGIASNFDQRLWQIVAGHAPLQACEGVFFSSEIGYAKPDVRFFRSIEQQLDVLPEALALVGDDSVNDHQGALAAGWQSIFLCRDGGPSDSASIRGLQELL